MTLRRQTRSTAVPLALAASASLALACSDSSGPDLPVVSSIAVSGLPDTLGAGDTLDLEAAAQGADGASLSRVALRWRSLTPAVASVDSTGRLAARDSGEATLVVTARGRSAVEDTITVPVRRLPRHIEFAGLPADSMFRRQRDSVSAVVRDGLGNVLPQRVRWSSSDTTTIVLLDTLGGVYTFESGDAWLRAEVRGFVDSVRVRVRDRFVATPVPASAFAPVGLLTGTIPASLRRCMLATTGRAWCTSESFADPFTEVAGGLVYRDLQASQSATCGLTPDDLMYCFGYNQFGNFGLESFDPRTSTTPILAANGRRFSSMSLGAHGLVCAIGVADSLAYCWGHNDNAQTGRFPFSGTNLAVAVVPGLPKVKQVSAGFTQACALAVDGSTWCWGAGFTTGASAASMLPQQVAAPGDYVEVAAGNGRHCGRTSSGVVACFGGIGVPHRPVTDMPPIVKLLGTSVEVGACGVTLAGAAYCWSDYSAGPTLTARRVFRTRTIRHLAVGWGGSLFCAVTTDNELYC